MRQDNRVERRDVVGSGCQFICRSFFTPWNIPQSTSTRASFRFEQVLGAGNRLGGAVET